MDKTQRSEMLRATVAATEPQWRWRPLGRSVPLVGARGRRETELFRAQ